MSEYIKLQKTNADKRDKALSPMRKRNYETVRNQERKPVYNRDVFDKLSSQEAKYYPRSWGGY